MTKKTMSNKRRKEAVEVVKQLSKNVDPSLRSQYQVIRKDLLKLRTDLARGYDMAKSSVEKKGFMKQLFGVK